jgi:molybdopterin converting factor subunit 1
MMHPMRITVRFFAVLKDRAGVAEAAMDLPPESNVSVALEMIGSRFPAILADLKRSAVAVNRNYAGHEVTLHDGDELALIPPVSGG